MTREELTLGYLEFKKLVAEKEFKNQDDIEWLHIWQAWDLSCSPMNDSERSLIRYGHYLGWYEGKREGKREGRRETLENIVKASETIMNRPIDYGRINTPKGDY